MAELADAPCAVEILYRESGGGGIDQSGVGATLGFHVGKGVNGGAPEDLVPFLLFVGGTKETVTMGGVSVERIVPLRHPFYPDMVAVAARWEKTGKPHPAAPGWTDHKVVVDFAYVPYSFGGDQ